ncbi:hypothetical protein Tco_1080939 [Tanacetum coccineum]|uniref:Reverse transcriptase domain-containing protein n=1 Tax=Tanacetum coccineum TaxID=301880 RepID=A0ABQ5HWB1_9ASTR
MLSSETKEEQKIWPPIIFLDLRTLNKIKSKTRKSRKHFLSKLLDRLLFMLIVPHGLQISQITMRGISLSRECHPNRIRKFFKDVKTLTSGMTFCSQNIDADQMIRRCVHGKEALDILEACHNGPTGGHHGANLTAQKWGENRDSWSDKTGLADLWAFVTAYKTPLGSHSVQACIWKGLSSAIELEHKAYWALKCKTFDLKTPGPFTIVQVFPYGTVELSQNSGPNFKVNGHRLKHYFGGGPGFLKPLVLAVFVLRSQELHNPQLHLGIPIS